LNGEQTHDECDIFDETLKAYFADRHSPPPKVREIVSQKLREASHISTANKDTPSRWVWGVALYNLLVSAALIYGLRLFFGPSVIVYAVAAYALLSMLASVAIVAYGLSMWARPAKP